MLSTKDLELRVRLNTIYILFFVIKFILNRNENFRISKKGINGHSKSHVNNNY